MTRKPKQVNPRIRLFAQLLFEGYTPEAAFPEVYFVRGVNVPTNGFGGWAPELVPARARELANHPDVGMLHRLWKENGGPTEPVPGSLRERGSELSARLPTSTEMRDVQRDLQTVKGDGSPDVARRLWAVSELFDVMGVPAVSGEPCEEVFTEADCPELFAHLVARLERLQGTGAVAAVSDCVGQDDNQRASPLVTSI